jgi:hypothetical protein
MMRKIAAFLLAAVLAAGFHGSASAQSGSGDFPSGTVCGNSTASTVVGGCTQASIGAILDRVLAPGGNGVIIRTGANTYAVQVFPITVAQGGTNCTTASGTCLDNITGFSSTGFLTRTGAGTYAFQSFTNGITFGNLAQLAAYSIFGNPTNTNPANMQGFTIDSLVTKTTPVAADELMLWDVAGVAMKKCTITQCVGAVTSGVASLNGLTGAITIAPGTGISVSSVGSTITIGYIAPAFLANINGTNQTGIADATNTKITFNTKVFDQGSFFSTVNNRWTPPAGNVHIGCQVTWNDNAAGDQVKALIFKNGAELFEQSLQSVNANSAIGVLVSASDVANGTDFYECFGFLSHGSGTHSVQGLITRTWFEGFLL